MLFFGLLLFLSSLLGAADPTTAVVVDSSSCVGSYQSIATVFRPGASARKLEDIESVGVMEYNLKDFYIRPKDAPAREPIPPKPLKQVQSIASTILSRSPDIVVCEEIVGPDTGRVFAKVLLKDKYTYVRVPSSEAREIGFFIKNDLPFHVDLENHLNLKWADTAKAGRQNTLFSRGLPTLLFRVNKEDPPFMAIIGHHGKAIRDRPHDSGSNALAQAQIQGIVDVTHDYESQFPKLPVAVVGDINRHLDSPEIIRAFGPLQNAFALPKVGIPKEQRVTHGAPGGENGPKTSQINGTLVNKAFAPRVVSTSVIAPVDSSGVPRSFPRTLQELDKADSDHRPHWVRFNIKDLLAPFITRQ